MGVATKEADGGASVDRWLLPDRHAPQADHSMRVRTPVDDSDPQARGGQMVHMGRGRFRAMPTLWAICSPWMGFTSGGKVLTADP
jgi:hypothetical protein